LSHAIQLEQESKSVGALSIVKNNSGKEIMDALRQHLKSFWSEEERLLKLRVAKFETDQNQMRVLSFVEDLVMMNILMGAGYGLQRSLLRPIIRLTKSVTKLAAGQKIEKALEGGNYELGQLAQAFNNMHDEVDERTKELQDQARFDQSFSHAVTACSLNRDLTTALSDSLVVHPFYHRSPPGAV